MRCKAGELAIITYDDSTNEHNAIGLIVEVVKFLSDSSPCLDNNFVYFPDQTNLGPIWHVRTLGSGIPLSQSSGETNLVSDSPWPDKWLAPLPQLAPETLEDIFMMQREAMAVVLKKLEQVKLADAPVLLFKLKSVGQIFEYSILKHGFQIRFNNGGPSVFYINISRN